MVEKLKNVKSLAIKLRGENKKKMKFDTDEIKRKGNFLLDRFAWILNL